MKPSLRQLEYLTAIADTGTFSEAAVQMHVSQPSLSAQIKDMELYLGAPLLERSRTGARLTPFGEIFVKRARIILRQVESLKTLTRDWTGSFAGKVALGTLPTVGPYLLPQAARQLHKAYPELRLEIREERTLDLHEDLMSGILDMIISTPEDHPSTESFPVVQENIYICVAADDPLATSRAPVELSELAGRELMTLGYGHKFAIVVQRLAAEAGAVTRSAYLGTSLDAIRQMAYMGVGVGVFPSLYAISEAKKDPELIVRRINHPSAQRQISLIWRETSPLAEKFEVIGGYFADMADHIMSEPILGNY